MCCQEAGDKCVYCEVLSQPSSPHVIDASRARLCYSSRLCLLRSASYRRAWRIFEPATLTACIVFASTTDYGTCRNRARGPAEMITTKKSCSTVVKKRFYCELPAVVAFDRVKNSCATRSRVSSNGVVRALSGVDDCTSVELVLRTVVKAWVSCYIIGR